MFGDNEFRQWQSMMERIFPAGITIATSPESIQAIATGYRRLFDALLNLGFDEAQALAITSGSSRSPGVSANGNAI